MHISNTTFFLCFYAFFDRFCCLSTQFTMMPVLVPTVSDPFNSEDTSFQFQPKLTMIKELMMRVRLPQTEDNGIIVDSHQWRECFFVLF